MTALGQAFLQTTDLARARRFYEDVLGLAPSRVGDTSVAYETGDCELKIQAEFDPETLAPFGLEPPPSTGRGAGAIHVLLTDEPLAAVHRRATERADALGAEVLCEPREVPWGDRMFLVRSPDGYTFELRRSVGEG